MKVLADLLSGTNDHNVLFRDLCTILETAGFSHRIKGDHHIYFKNGIDEIINIQPKGSNAKAYQVKQVRKIMMKYNIGGTEHV